MKYCSLLVCFFLSITFAFAASKNMAVSIQPNNSNQLSVSTSSFASWCNVDGVQYRSIQSAILASNCENILLTKSEYIENVKIPPHRRVRIVGAKRANGEKVLWRNRTSDSIIHISGIGEYREDPALYTVTIENIEFSIDTNFWSPLDVVFAQDRSVRLIDLDVRGANFQQSVFTLLNMRAVTAVNPFTFEIDNIDLDDVEANYLIRYVQASRSKMGARLMFNDIYLNNTLSNYDTIQVVSNINSYGDQNLNLSGLFSTNDRALGGALLKLEQLQLADLNNISIEEGEFNLRAIRSHLNDELYISDFDILDTDLGIEISNTSKAFVSDGVIEGSSRAGLTAGSAFHTICVGTQSDLRVENVDFIGNSSFVGGAVYIDQNYCSGSVDLSNNLFEENYAHQSGGALFVNNRRSSVVVKNNSFLLNTAAQYGGGAVYSNPIKTRSMSRPAFQHNLNFYKENTAQEHSGGGAIFIGYSAVLNSEFSRNTSGTGGGGAHVQDAAHTSFINTHFDRNNASFGGGLFISKSSHVSMIRSSLTNNYVSYRSYKYVVAGAGLYVSDTAYDNRSISYLYHSIESFKSRTLSESGRPNLYHPSKTLLTLVESTLSGNIARKGGVGGAIANKDANLNIAFSDFINNHTIDRDGSALYHFDDSGETTFFASIFTDKAYGSSFESDNKFCSTTSMAKNRIGNRGFNLFSRIKECPFHSTDLESEANFTPLLKYSIKNYVDDKRFSHTIEGRYHRSLLTNISYKPFKSKAVDTISLDDPYYLEQIKLLKQAIPSFSRPALNSHVEDKRLVKAPRADIGRLEHDPEINTAPLLYVNYDSDDE